MALFWSLAGFECKKMLGRKRAVIALALVILLGLLSVYGTLIGKGSYADGSGGIITLSGYEEAMLNRKSKEAISGRTLDARLILEAAEAYRQEPRDPDTGMTAYRYIEASAKYSGIYRLAGAALGIRNREDFANLSPELAGQFDSLRCQSWEQALESSQVGERMRQAQQEWLKQAAAPLIYTYSGGYDRYYTIMFSTAMMAGVAIAILLAGLFADEYATGADSLILSSKHGKGLLIGAKLFVAFAVSLSLILLLAVASFIEAVAVWGGAGAEGSLALIANVFPYPLTIRQAALWYSLCAVGACLLFAAAALLLSAVLKNAVNAIALLSVLLMLPIFITLPAKAPHWIQALYHLLPTNMMLFEHTMGQHAYALGGLILPPYVFMPLFSAAAAALCAAFAYRAFKKHAAG